ncbi:uncharacterized protein PSFLO_07789 [Pseudozyma flocculosa]|uniref:Peptidase S9 prolyl oligopeptidase catalytic domain-containing protein n=1 Tax=Pseudozyma flocculosa TaxID=84751 RepID=A0A5C3FDW8_9BASI|nr:uncharacterized protein PSFLO_07789 [Pseudozyma flocculosa]
MAAASEVGNGLKRVSIYEPEIEIPPLAGLLLFSGISDPHPVPASLSGAPPLRGQNILDTRLLPPKVLLVHGGKDSVVPVEQSTLLKTLLVGIGVENVKLRAYRHLGHAESLACLFLGMGRANTRYTRQILDDVAAFIGQ